MDILFDVLLIIRSIEDVGGNAAVGRNEAAEVFEWKVVTHHVSG